MTDLEGRRRQKETESRYREAARRLASSAGLVSVSDFANVVEDVRQQGAFVEVNIWIPRHEMEKEQGA